MKELILKNEVEKEIARKIIKGERINNYCISNIASGKFSLDYIAERVIKSKKGREIYITKQEVIKQIAEKTCKRDNLENIINFALNIKNAPMDIILHYIIKSKSLKRMYNFIREEPNIQLEVFVDGIIGLELSISDSHYLKLIYNIILEMNENEAIRLWKKFIEIGDNNTIFALSLKVDKQYINNFTDLIIKTNDAKMIYEFTEKRQDELSFGNILKLTDAIIKTKINKYIYYFADEVRKSPKGKLLDALIELESLHTVSFPRSLILSSKDRADAICEIVIKKGQAYSIIQFATKLGARYIDKLTDAIIATNDIEDMYIFARDVSKEDIRVDIQKIYNAMLKIARGEYYYDMEQLYLFISEFSEQIDIKKAVRRFIKEQSIDHVIRVAENFENISINKLQEAVINSNDEKYILEFAKQVKKADVDKLATAICNTGKAEYIYVFARDIPNAPIEKLAEGILATNHYGYIYDFAKKIENVPIKKFVQKLVRL